MKTGESYIGSREKRTFDVIGSSLLMTAAAPIAGTSALALCIAHRNFSPLFLQDRRGRNHDVFTTFKLRTIPEQGTDGFFDTYGPLDPRASWLGQLVRQVGIDEIPQTFNVLRNDMSLVGIRPQVDSVLEQRRDIDSKLFDDWFYCYGQNPGLFGAGQAYAHEAGYYQENSEAVRTIMQLDIEAFEAASLRNDIRTIVCQPFELIKTTVQRLSADTSC